MKKIKNYYLSALLIAGLGFMSSCGGDDEPDPAPKAPAAMETYTAKILGNQQASVGSFFSSSDGTVISAADSKTNANKIDFGYYFSTGGDASVKADSATIASPKDVNGAKVFGAIGSTDFANWAMKNNTMFKSLAGDAYYTGATDGDQVAAAYMNTQTTATTSINRLKVGSVFAFMTQAGKHGVAKVTALKKATVADNKSEITILVKVEK